MKLHLLSMTAIAAAMLLALPAQAAPPDGSAGASGALATAGVADLQLGWRHMREDDDPASDSHLAAGANVRASIPLSGMFSVQGDAQGEWFNVDDGGNDTPESDMLFGAHLSARDPNAWLAGVFAGLGVQNSEGTDSGWIAGLEGQGYFNDLTVYGQLGWGDIETDSNPDEGFNGGWFLRGVGRYFVQDDTMVSGELAYGHVSDYIDSAPTDDGDFWNWGLSGQTRLPVDLPLYGTLEYRGGHYHTSDQSGDTAKDHAFLAGISVHFGTNSLKHNDRYGATLDLPMLPVRAASWTESLD